MFGSVKVLTVVLLIFLGIDSVLPFSEICVHVGVLFDEYLTESILFPFSCYLPIIIGINVNILTDYDCLSKNCRISAQITSNTPNTIEYFPNKFMELNNLLESHPRVQYIYQQSGIRYGYDKFLLFFKNNKIIYVFDYEDKVYNQTFHQLINRVVDLLPNKYRPIVVIIPQLITEVNELMKYIKNKTNE